MSAVEIVKEAALFVGALAGMAVGYSADVAPVASLVIWSRSPWSRGSPRRAFALGVSYRRAWPAPLRRP